MSPRPTDLQALHADLPGLVERIHIVNGCWHGLRDLWPPADAHDPVLQAMRSLKALLQAQLLRLHHPRARLVFDSDPALSEPCYSVRLEPRVGSHRDACHLPVRVARACLSSEELARFSSEEP